MKTPICLRLAALAAALAAFPSVVLATTYYVDNVNGNDSHAGTSSTTAWKTVGKVNGHTFSGGDSILFIRGGSWTNQLSPLGSGSSGSPIIVDAYGTGAAPLIQASGSYPAALTLTNQQYWEINNLELTNTAGAAASRYGVLISASDAGTLHHLHFENLEIHAVTGDDTDKDSGGMLFSITGSATATLFDDVMIKGCYVHDLARTGISLESSWSTRTATTNTNWTPSTHVQILDNVISNIDGNGLIWRVSSAPLIQNNLWTGCGATISGNAMFVFQCDNALIEANEAYGTVYNSGDTDAAGFDDDFNNNGTVIEYNYSHDNGLGGIVAVSPNTGFNQNPIIRYNILQNNLSETFRISGNVTGAAIYNNTVYLDSTLSSNVIFYHKVWGNWPNGTGYKNNLIVNNSTTSSYSFGSSTGNVFDYNEFSGQHPTSEPADSHKLTSDPQLADAGSGGNGLDSVDGYRLLTGSPALGSGVLISSNGGLDYFGNTVSSSAKPNRGADNGSGESALTVAKEFEDLVPSDSSGQAATIIYDGSASGGAWVKFEATASAQYVTYAYYVPAGTYTIALATEKANDRGILQLATSGDGTTFYNKDSTKDEYSATSTWTTINFTDTVAFPSSGTKYFRFTVTGKNASSSGYSLSLDKITLVKQ